MSGTLAAAGTFISERTERTSEMSLISQPISASASAFSRPRGSGQDASIRTLRAALRLVGELRPQLLGDEGHEGMEQLEGLVEHESSHGARLGRGICSGPARSGLISSRYQSQ
jgi:hypothetical protein